MTNCWKFWTKLYAIFQCDFTEPFFGRLAHCTVVVPRLDHQHLLKGHLVFCQQYCHLTIKTRRTARHLDHLKQLDHIGEEEKSLSPEFLSLSTSLELKLVFIPGQHLPNAPGCKRCQMFNTLRMQCGRIDKLLSLKKCILLLILNWFEFDFVAFTFYARFQMWAVCPCW